MPSYRALHSLSRTILCRSQCDACCRVIRFLGVRCKHCRLKFHKKCSSSLSDACKSCGNLTGKGKRYRVKRFWRRGYESFHGKWPPKENVGVCNRKGTSKSYLSWDITTQKYIDARGKFRQKLLNGFYESLCYGPRQALEFQPTGPGRTGNRTITVEVEQHDCFEREGRDSVDYRPHEAAPPVSRNQSLSSWLRDSSWTSRSMTGTTSSGYSSAHTSCPSSANSHRSSSPPPDFSTRHIRLLSATMAESHSLEDNDFIGDEEELDGATFDPVATWPPRTESSIARRNGRRISSVNDCQAASYRGQSASSDLESSCAQQNREDIKKSLREWRISYSDLQFGDVVGVGPKGQVFKGRWHGDIMIHTTAQSSKQDLDDFLKEVSLLSMIRHENVVLFMGACLEPPNLAVITSVRKGLSLHSHLHLRQDLFNLQNKISIARQIAQGMSYLHAKGIVLPTLNSMNIFLESKVKLCVSGYASQATRIEREGFASVPRGHMTYLSPELMRRVRIRESELLTTQKHTVQSNLYTYGTLLYEILTCKWPFATCPSHAVIWLIGSGRQQCTRQVASPENLKKLMRDCWSKCPEERPNFHKIVRFMQEQNVGRMYLLNLGLKELTVALTQVPAQSSQRRLSSSEPLKLNLVGRKGRLCVK